MVDFNIQQALQDLRTEVAAMRVAQTAELSSMRDEQRVEHREITEKVDAALAKINKHETEIALVKQSQAAGRKLGWTALVTSIGLLAEVIRDRWLHGILH